MMPKLYEVIYFDEQTGDVGSVLIAALSEYRAADKVERQGSFEVVEVEFVDFYEGPIQ